MLVVAIVVAVAGIGVALTLRLSSRQRGRAPARRPAAAGPGRARRPAAPVTGMGAALAASRASARISADRAVPDAALPPAEPPDPVQAHQAKLAALQALLELGDAKAAAAEASGIGRFADTEPVDDDYAATQFVDRSDAAAAASPLLNLDKLKPRRSRLQR
jgi:hypothetical protein